MKDKEYVSIEEMIAITNNQLKILKSIEHYDKLSPEELYKKREEILKESNKLLGYREVHEGVALTSMVANPISPIRERLFNATKQILIEVLKVEDFELSIVDSYSIRKGYLQLLANTEEYKQLNPYGKGIILGRLSVYTNEFQLYDFTEDLKRNTSENNQYNEIIERCNKKIGLFLSVLDESKTFKDLKDEATERGEDLGTIKERLLAKKMFNEIRSNPEQNKKCRDEVKSLKEMVENLENRIIREKEEEIRSKELKRKITRNREYIRNKLIELGYKENNDKYFAYA